MTDYPGYDNPQLTVDTGTRHGRHLDCCSCRRRIDTTLDYWVLWTGTRARPDIQAVAHYGIDDDPDTDVGCFGPIRQRWQALAQAAGAGLIHRDGPVGYWTLQGEDLHCGTPLQILTGAGTWLTGHYEVANGLQGLSPVVYVALGGIGGPEVGIPVHPSALIRPWEVPSWSAGWR